MLDLPGTHLFDIHLVSENYVGLNFRAEFEIKTEKIKEEKKTENLKDEPEVLEELKEKEESFFEFTFGDILTLIVFAVVSYFVLPETEFGRRYVIPVFQRFRKAIEDLRKRVIFE